MPIVRKSSARRTVRAMKDAGAVSSRLSMNEGEGAVRGGHRKSAAEVPETELPGLRARVEPTWVLTRGDGELVDTRLLPLLEAVATSGSLQQAAKQIGLSYRHAWTIATPWAAPGGLLKLARGQGAALTEAGAELIRQVDRARARWLSEASRWRDLDLCLNASQMEKIKLCASHDLLLAEALPAFASQSGLSLETVFRGSTEAIAALRDAQCDAAGFHAPADPAHPLNQQMMALMHEVPGVAYRALFGRVQGLIVERGNPHGIRGLHDLMRQRLCFVNRQRGSGTRLLFDRLLADEDIPSSGIVGYGHEEFTHAAVAATVAAGAAQAGFGNEAAARLFKLDFVPLIEEHYFLAWRVRSVALDTLLGVLEHADWRQRVQETAGYRLLQAIKEPR